ncbi:ATP-binding protein [Candidatus Neptunochlamydia vexilliferae]|nr:ATP-binding protein [Candidatus Neptunochlamydia vexilliferae]
MKKLPIGIQTIDKIITNGYVYVDKTEHALKLIRGGAYYFLARPRRFGKSLFLNTLKEIFLGNKELFKDCAIYSSDYSWEKHPVIYFDFTKIPSHTPEQLEASLKRTLKKASKLYNKNVDIPSVEEGLDNLVEELTKDNKVIVLIDEYDKPLIDRLSSPEIAKANREILKSFFGTLKGLDEHLKFVFVTGVSKFSQVSLFSGFNNLEDITVDPISSTIMGYTEEEIRKSFADHLDHLAKGSSQESLINEMRRWYNGYRFSREGAPVYNPHSTLKFLKTGHTQSYWYSTVTPSFLIEQIKERPLSSLDLSQSEAKETELLNINDIQKIDLQALMWQTGYLTLRNYDPQTSLYELDFPNQEVREAFFDSLLSDFAEIKPSKVITAAAECKQELENIDLDAFFERINHYFASVPYTLFENAREGFYHAVFLSLLEGMGIKTYSEQKTNIGRIDLVVEMPLIIYIFEFKKDQSADAALEQIKNTKYGEKYTQSGKKLIHVGVNFSSKSRNISEWKALGF